MVWAAPLGKLMAWSLSVSYVPIFQGSFHTHLEEPNFLKSDRAHVAEALGDRLWVHLSLRGLATLWLLRLLGTTARKQAGLWASAQTPCPLCVELESTRHAGPSPALPSCGLLPHTNLQAHRHEP